MSKTELYQMADRVVAVVAILMAIAFAALALGIGALGILSDSAVAKGLGIVGGVAMIVFALYNFGVAKIMWNLEKNRKGLVYNIFRIFAPLSLLISVLSLNIIGIVMDGYVTGRLYKMIK